MSARLWIPVEFTRHNNNVYTYAGENEIRVFVNTYPRRIRRAFFFFFFLFLITFRSRSVCKQSSLHTAVLRFREFEDFDHSDKTFRAYERVCTRHDIYYEWWFQESVLLFIIFYYFFFRDDFSARTYIKVFAAQKINPKTNYLQNCNPFETWAFVRRIRIPRKYTGYRARRTRQNFINILNSSAWVFD